MAVLIRWVRNIDIGINAVPGDYKWSWLAPFRDARHEQQERGLSEGSEQEDEL